MSTFKPDAGIPLLTEIIDVPELKTPASVPDEAPDVPVAPQDNLPHWERLEQELHERVLQQVLKRIDTVLEQRVRDSLADVLQTAVESLSAEIRDGLQRAVAETVATAVALEVEAARSSKK